MNKLKDIPELINAGIITQETADRIQDYYKSKSTASVNRLFIVFGVLGSILVGLGIILIIAHNWDDLSKVTKTVFAFIPLLIGQLLCGFALVKKEHNAAFKESACAFLFLSVGASISLISQIYNIPGNLSTFLLTWMLLCLPLIYLMKSSVTSLLYLVGITWYAVESGFRIFQQSQPYPYWLLLLIVIPYYYLLCRKNAESNFVIFHNWLIPLSVTIALGTVADKVDELMFIAYFSLFGLFYLIGNRSFFSQQKLRNNAYRIIGSLGTIILLLVVSFEWFWKNLRKEEFVPREVIVAPEFVGATILSLLASVLLFVQYRSKTLKDKPIALVFILFIVAFVVGYHFPIGMILINLYLFMVSILIIRNGAKHDHLGLLNFGLLIIATLIICRFFDTQMSFVVRGILFVLVGTGFFVANYWTLKRRKTHEQ